MDRSRRAITCNSGMVIAKIFLLKIYILLIEWNSSRTRTACMPGILKRYSWQYRPKVHCNVKLINFKSMSNTGITLVDVRSEAMDAIQQLKSGKIDVKTAGAIKDLLNTVVDTAKTQVEYMKVLPKSVKEQMTVVEVKAIAGTLVDRDAEMDATMAEVRESQSRPYESK